MNPLSDSIKPAIELIYGSSGEIFIALSRYLSVLE